MGNYCCEEWEIGRSQCGLQQASQAQRREAVKRPVSFLATPEFSAENLIRYCKFFAVTREAPGQSYFHGEICQGIGTRMSDIDLAELVDCGAAELAQGRGQIVLEQINHMRRSTLA